MVAHHAGPYLSINPLEVELGGSQVSYVVDGMAREERIRQNLPYVDSGQVTEKWGNFENLLVEGKVEAVIRSTSEESAAGNVEMLATRAADNLKIPVFVVEDFPGNYQPAPDEPLAGLFVDDDSMLKIHRSRGIDRDKIFTTGNPRYDWLQTVDRVRARRRTRKALGLGNERVAFWAGQPDDDNSYLTLKRILEHFPKSGPTILFRAHPRDQAFNAGRYEQLIEAGPVKIIDVTDWPDNIDLCCASDLVITQFSSVAVEASHLGVPAMFVLFEDLGQRFFRKLKDYDRPLWCEDGCAFVIEHPGEIMSVIHSATQDESAREAVKANFQRRFGVRNNSAKLIADRIKEVVSETPKEVLKRQ